MGSMLPYIAAPWILWVCECTRGGSSIASFEHGVRFLGNKVRLDARTTGSAGISRYQYALFRWMMGSQGATGSFTTRCYLLSEKNVIWWTWCQQKISYSLFSRRETVIVAQLKIPNGLDPARRKNEPSVCTSTV